MSINNSSQPHDFEVIPPADALPKNPSPTPATDDGKSIQDLFDRPNEPGTAQIAAKAGILLSLPHQMMWSAVTAIFVALCQPAPNENSPLDELVYNQISFHIQDRLDQTRKRLAWVDKELPAVVERYNNHMSGALKRVRSAKDEAFVRGSPIVTRVSQIAFCAIAAPFLFSFFFRSIFWLGSPVWLCLGLGYWIGKRRERWSSRPSPNTGRFQGQWRRHY